MGKALNSLVKGRTKHAKKRKTAPKVESATYLTRNRAIKRLNISMPDFRRLCILKGIHPRVPNRKVLKQGGRQSNFYLSKDISHLYYDPLLTTLRNLKTYQNKIKKASGRMDFEKVAQLKKQKPEYTLNHIIKERYPTFPSALRELGDALHVLSLISTLPVSSQVTLEDVSTCSLLLKQFLAFVVHHRLLDHVFLSIKGIYYQVTIQGQVIVWLTPFEFPQSIPKSVDLQLIMNYCEFYQVLLSFVNFRLYTTNGLRYPPPLKEITNPNHVSHAVFEGRSKRPRQRLLEHRSGVNDEAVVEHEPEDNDSSKQRTEEEMVLERQRVMFLDAIVLEKTSKNVVSTTPEIKSVSAQNNTQTQIQTSKKLMESLPTKLISIAENESQNVDDDVDGDQNTEQNERSDENISKPDDPRDEEEELLKEMGVESKSHTLFEGLHFYLSREVPKNVFEFVITSFGGKVSWDNEHEPSITHHVIDRPLTSTTPSFLARIYVQPQWIADSINAKFLLPIDEYAPGQTLPPHLSPFTSSTPLLTANSAGGDEEAEQYVPQRQLEINDIIRGIDHKKKYQEQEQQEEEKLQELEEEIEEQEMNYLKELSQEQGFSLSQDTVEPVETKKNKKRNRSTPQTGLTAARKLKLDTSQQESLELLQKKRKSEERKREREDEELELRKQMIPRKKRVLYNKLSTREQRTKDWVENLKTKKQLIDSREKNKSHSNNSDQ